MSDANEAERDQVDWQQLMQFGLGVLGLSPGDFWDMTPREFVAASEGRLGATGPEASMDHAELAALIQRHPDRTVPSGGYPYDEH